MIECFKVATNENYSIFFGKLSVDAKFTLAKVCHRSCGCIVGITDEKIIFL